MIKKINKIILLANLAFLSVNAQYLDTDLYYYDNFGNKFLKDEAQKNIKIEGSFDTYNNRYGNYSYNLQPSTLSGTADYYTEGIKNVREAIDEEINNMTLTNSIIPNLYGKTIILIQIDNLSFEDIIFYKSIAKEIGIDKQSVAKNNKNNKNYLIFGSYTDEKKADETLQALKYIKINAEKIKNNQNEYLYSDFLTSKINKDFNKKGTTHIPVKVVVIEKTKYLGEETAKISQKSETKNQISHKKDNVKQKSKNITNSNLKNKEDKEEIKKEKAEYEKEIKEKKIKDCLNKVINEIKYYGLFNLETLQFKHNNIIYDKGVQFSFDGCDFNITDISKNNQNILIEFNNLKKQKLIAKVDYPSGVRGFFPIEKLFYNPEYELEVERSKRENQYLAQKNNDMKFKEAKTQDNKSKQEEEIKPTSEEYKEESQKQAVSNTLTESKVCSFVPLKGIRTQFIAKKDGTYKKEPIYSFYQGKNLKVDYYYNADKVVLSAMGGQQMVVDRHFFERYCN